MRKIVLALLSAVALPMTAAAADLTIPYKNPSYGPVSDSGFFITTELGGSAGTAGVDFVSVPGFAQSFQPSGFLLGGGIGYKGKVGGVVLGLVADADYAWTNGGGNCATPGGMGSCGLSSHILMTQRGILGVPFMSTNAFIGVTGGAAERSLGATVLPIGTSNQWATGWTLGGIVEAPIASHLSLGVQVLYINYNATATVGPIGVAVMPGANLTLSQEVVGKVGLNWHF